MSSNEIKNRLISSPVNLLIATSALIFILYAGRTFFVPLFFGLLIAILMYPASRRMERNGISRTLSVTFSIVFIIALFGLLLWMLGYEVNLFLAKVPEIKVGLSRKMNEAALWINENFPIANEKDFSSNLLNNIFSGINIYFNKALYATFSSLFVLIMIPIYAALFLYHRGTFVRFILTLTKPEYKDKVNLVITKSIYSYFKFVKGTFFVYCIVGILNSIGLLLLGINHAILFGMVTAFMTAIPYVGIIISAALPISVALVTKDSIWYPIGVIAVFTFVQYLEANIIYPRVVGQQLNLSTWAVLTAILIGSLIWGISGMILFIPFAAILKLVSDSFEELRPVNILLNREEGYTSEKRK